MRTPISLTYDDVLLVPQYSDIKSRSEIEVGVAIGGRYSRPIHFKLPIISSPMDTVTGAAMANVMNKSGGLGIIHRYCTVDEQAKMVRRIKAGMKAAAIGVTGDYHDRAKVLRSWGRMSTLIKDSENINKRLGIKLKGIDYDRKFVFSESGYNFEPSDIGASFGLIQLKKFKKFTNLRNRNFQYHCNFFGKFKDVFIVPKIEKDVKTNFLAYPIILRDNLNFSRKDLQIYLEKNKIQTRPIFSGNILRHPAFSSLISKRNKLNSFKNSDYIMKYGLLIGCHQGLKKKDVNFIHKKINYFLENL